VLEPAEGLLPDQNTEKALLDTKKWAVDESSVPDPIPPLEHTKRTKEEEVAEYDEINLAINDNRGLAELRTTFAASAPRNQSQFDKLKHLWPKLNAATGDREAVVEYDAYRAAKALGSHGADVASLERVRSRNMLLGWVANDIAWGLATDQDPAHRDPAIAVQRAVEACQQVRWQYWGFLDTLAAALAADGRFETAVRVAEAALARAPDEERAQVEFAIDRYKQGLAWAPLVP
jgi:hypothetical protein